MYNKLCNMKIQSRLFIIIAVALTVLVVMASILLYKENIKSQSATRFNELAMLTPILGQAIHDLQKERGQSTFFISESGKAEVGLSLQSQKKNTDTALKVLSSNLLFLYDVNGKILCREK